ncbi:hypothetical protein Acsp04_10480 [Actinomadura sp. NBRC 104425]|nr:hypothetical protein Acsp04_10480 [Actinomadura sp. NBRC 104425]
MASPGYAVEHEFLAIRGLKGFIVREGGGIALPHLFSGAAKPPGGQRIVASPYGTSRTGPISP